MSWGRATDEHEAREMLGLFLDAGGNLIDTADVYADGASERMIGQLLAECGRRDDVVLATKTVSRPGEDRRFDASRGHLLRSLDASLRRLRADVIDLWQLHAWDRATPLDETLAAVDDAVSAGKVRYVGVSNYCGWQLAKTAEAMRREHPRAVIVAAQQEYSLLERGIEREVVGAAESYGVGLLAWSPLGRGVLTGKYRSGTPAESRAADPKWASFVAPFLGERCARVVDAVCTAADGLDVAPAEVALAWVRDQPGVVAPVVGARNGAQLRCALDSERLDLPVAIRAALADVSTPALGYPEHGWNQR